ALAAAIARQVHQMQSKMRSQFRRDAMPHFRIQAPSVQQHKMTIPLSFGLPPDVIHQLLFSLFSCKEARHANSTGAVLAMPSAAAAGALGDLLLLHRVALHYAIP